MTPAPRMQTAPFPFTDHRTQAEVAETDRLQRLWLFGLIKPHERRRLTELYQKAKAANGEPPC